MQIARCVGLLLVVGPSHAEILNWVSVPDETLTRRLSAVPVKNEDRGARLEEMLKEAGCTGDCLKRGCVNQKWDNIISTLPGSTDEVIVIGAHYEHVTRGEGALDNWSGSSLLASLYHTIAASEGRFTYMFVGFSEEEKGLYGARAFVKDLGKEKLPKVRAMINIDSVAR
jgi:coenzyme F420-reducing hydrogenase delta subunit